MDPISRANLLHPMATGSRDPTTTAVRDASRAKGEDGVAFPAEKTQTRGKAAVAAGGAIASLASTASTATGPLLAAAFLRLHARRLAAERSRLAAALAGAERERVAIEQRREAAAGRASGDAVQPPLGNAAAAEAALEAEEKANEKERERLAHSLAAVAGERTDVVRRRVAVAWLALVARRKRAAPKADEGGLEPTAADHHELQEMMAGIHERNLDERARRIARERMKVLLADAWTPESQADGLPDYIVTTWTSLLRHCHGPPPDLAPARLVRPPFPAIVAFLRTLGVEVLLPSEAASRAKTMAEKYAVLRASLDAVGELTETPPYGLPTPQRVLSGRADEETHRFLQLAIEAAEAWRGGARLGKQPTPWLTEPTSERRVGELPPAQVTQTQQHRARRMSRASSAMGMRSDTPLDGRSFASRRCWSVTPTPGDGPRERLPPLGDERSFAAAAAWRSADAPPPRADVAAPPPPFHALHRLIQWAHRETGLFDTLFPAPQLDSPPPFPFVHQRIAFLQKAIRLTERLSGQAVPISAAAAVGGLDERATANWVATLQGLVHALPGANDPKTFDNEQARRRVVQAERRVLAEDARGMAPGVSRGSMIVSRGGLGADEAAFRLPRERAAALAKRLSSCVGRPVRPRDLEQPHFNVIHGLIADIVRSKTTTFGDDLFTEAELSADAFTHTGTKVEFLARFLVYLSRVVDRPIDVQPLKIIGAMEVDKTAAMLDALADAAGGETELPRTTAIEALRASHAHRPVTSVAGLRGSDSRLGHRNERPWTGRRDQRGHGPLDGVDPPVRAPRMGTPTGVPPQLDESKVKALRAEAAELAHKLAKTREALAQVDPQAVRQSSQPVNPEEAKRRAREALQAKMSAAVAKAVASKASGEGKPAPVQSVADVLMQARTAKAKLTPRSLERHDKVHDRVKSIDGKLEAKIAQLTESVVEMGGMHEQLTEAKRTLERRMAAARQQDMEPAEDIIDLHKTITAKLSVLDAAQAKSTAELSALTAKRTELAAKLPVMLSAASSGHAVLPEDHAAEQLHAQQRRKSVSIERVQTDS